MSDHGGALVFVLAALLAACSSRSSDTSNPPSAPTPNAVAPAAASLASEDLPAPPSGVKFVDGIAASSSNVGHIDLFAVSSVGAIWTIAFDQHAWQDWQTVADAGTADTGVSAASSADGSIDLFYRDAASLRLGHTYLDESSEWQDELLGKSEIMQLTPSAASSDSGRLDVFTQGPDSTLIHIWQTDEWTADWITETKAKNVASATTVTASGGARLDVFWSGGDANSLKHWWSDDDAPQLETSANDTLGSAPAAASRGAGLFDVVYMSNDSVPQLVRQYFDEGWAAESYPFVAATSVASASWGPGRLDVFGLASKRSIRHAIVPGASVLTQHNDVARTGGNTHEVELNVDNVASDNFGKLFTIPVDGNVWAQPLYRAAVDLSDVGQGVRNALYVATGNDSVYLFDADTGDALAQTSLGHPVPVPYGDFTTGGGSTAAGSQCVFNSIPQIGITSTPVLDPDTDTLYVVALTADEELQAEVIAQCAPPQDPTHVYRVQLHALDSHSLQERPGSPVTVQPSYDYEGTNIPFQANRENQRTSLLLSHGKIYLAFASFTDRRPFYGWVVSYDASTLAQADVWIDTPEGSALTGGGMGGIWQSGEGLTADPDGNVYFTTGNGPGGKHYQYANAAIELSSTLSVVSSFRPSNADALDQNDLDFSSSGAMLIPGTQLVVSGTKEGKVYVMNQGNLGGNSTTSDDVAFEDLTAVPDDDCEDVNDGISNLHSSVIYWQSRTDGANLYLMGEADHAKKLALDTDSGQFSVVAQSDVRAPCGMPGGFLSVSSNGDNPKTAIVWANVPTDNAVEVIVPAHFYAFNAETLETLYEDDSRASVAATAKFAKNVAPTVANGRVYQAAFGPSDENLGMLNDQYSGSVVVYGLKSK